VRAHHGHRVLALDPAGPLGHLLRARAIESQCFVVGVNRVGEGDGLLFTGGSAILDPLGQVLAHGGDKEILVMADADPALVKEVRSALPFLRDRKPHLL